MNIDPMIGAIEEVTRDIKQSRDDTHEVELSYGAERDDIKITLLNGHLARMVVTTTYRQTRTIDLMTTKAKRDLQRGM